MKRKSLMAIVMVTMVLSLTGCGESKKELRAELEEVRSEKNDLQDEVADLKQQVSALELEKASLTQQADADANETFLALVFPQDGNFYTVSDKNFKFYTDQACEKMVKNVRIVSPVVEERTRENGFVICICLSDQGLVYSTSWPNLVIDKQ